MKRFAAVIALLGLCWFWNKPPRTQPAGILPTRDEAKTAAVAPPTARAEDPEYSLLLQSTFEKLPRLNQLDDSNSDFHRPPREVLALTKEFGEIAEHVHRSGSPKESSMSFYYRCAADIQVILPIRVVCLRDLKRGISQGLTKQNFSLNAIESEVHELADDLP